MQDRIFLVRPADVLTPQQAREHWEERHGPIFARTEGLIEYRQNRPVDGEWERGLNLVCSQTCFADRASERAAYAGSYYRSVVAADESAFLDRESAWSAVLLGELAPPVNPTTIRLLWFDASPPPGLDWRVVDLARPVPPPGHGSTLHFADTLDDDRIEGITRTAGPVAFACRPVSFAVDPPPSA